MIIHNERLVLDALEFYDIKKFNTCGYMIVNTDPDVSPVKFDTLNQALAQTPKDGDQVYREFGGVVDLVAKHFELTGWTMVTNSRMTGIGRITLPPGGQIPSLNAEYIPTANRGRAGKTLSAKGRKYKQLIVDQCEFSDLPGFFENMRALGWTRTHQHYRVTLEFYYTYLHNKRDVTNMIKLTEDGLAEVVGNNDSRNKIVRVSEYESPDEFEHVHIKYELINIG